MYEYFPIIPLPEQRKGIGEGFYLTYFANINVAASLSSGGDINEIVDASRPSLDNIELVRTDLEKWSTELGLNWFKVAERLEAQAERDLTRGWRFSAAERLRRASLMQCYGHRSLPVGHEKKTPYYDRMGANFRRYLDLSDQPAEYVQIDYDGKTLQAIMFHPPGKGRKPYLVGLNGGDSDKELLCHTGAPAALLKRGIGFVMVDQPGTGHAMWKEHIPATPEPETYGRPIYDYLKTRREVDPDRVGIMGFSLGGYYAPRIAAYDERYAATVAWGTFYEWPLDLMFPDGPDGTSIETNEESQARRGMTSQAALFERMSKEKFTPEMLAQIKCPFLIMDHENDRHIYKEGAWGERMLRDARNSPRAELKVFTEEEGGAEHCGFDNYTTVAEFMASWLADAFDLKT